MSKHSPSKLLLLKTVYRSNKIYFLLPILSILIISCSQDSTFKPDPKESSSTIAPTASPNENSTNGEVLEVQMSIPQSQRAFIDVIKDFSDDLDNAFSGGNELKYGAVINARNNQLCQIIKKSGAKNWVGTIIQISEIRGKAEVKIRISSDEVYVSNLAFEINESNQILIPPSSSTFKTLVELNEGDEVKFSATFVRSKKSCLQNALEEYYETMPIFRVIFEKIVLP